MTIKNEKKSTGKQCFERGHFTMYVRKSWQYDINLINDYANIYIVNSCQINKSQKNKINNWY